VYRKNRKVSTASSRQEEPTVKKSIDRGYPLLLKIAYGDHVIITSLLLSI
jgi:hypothetical protein